MIKYRVNPVAHRLPLIKCTLHPPASVRCLRRQESPLPAWRLLHYVNVDPLARERRHVERPVAEPALNHLVPTLEDNHVVGAVVGRSVSHLDARSLLHPLLPRLVGRECPSLRMTLSSVREAALGHHQLAEDESDDVRGLPVGGVEEVGKGVGGEVGETVRAVEGVVQPLAPPPFGSQAAHRLHLLGVKDPGLDALVAGPPATTSPAARRGVVEKQGVGLDDLDQAGCVAVASGVLAVSGHVDRGESGELRREKGFEPRCHRVAWMEQIVHLNIIHHIMAADDFDDVI